ncbi:MAG: AAA family ATPase [Alistipes sp.]|nr:AAA family ATPase [Alistipes sp.]
MTTKVIFVAGVPATGKTTLFKRIRERLFEQCSEFKEGKVRGIENGCYKMLGVFDGSTFEGTDRLSMTVIGDAIDYIKRLEQEPGRKVVFVEGDRLFNFRFLQETRASLILLDASPEVLAQRHKERGDNQTETFLQSRRTKVENFANKYRISRAYNNAPEDAEKIFQFIIKTAEQWVGECTTT